MASAKPTTCKEAIRRWEEETEHEAATATEVILSFQWPPIEKMDNALAVLANCEKLSLSTNMIEKIAGKKCVTLSFKYTYIIIFVIFNKLLSLLVYK